VTVFITLLRMILEESGGGEGKWDERDEVERERWNGTREMEWDEMMREWEHVFMCLCGRG